MSRKTIEIETLRKWVNDQNVESHDRVSEARSGWNHLLERALHATNTYHGFRYNDGYEVVQADTHDDTRRYYF